eukprot:TRINITY_DN22434_c0_g1_i1.p1 TRINITY_DN22434_c0_g1~~TRINITY_DN22434_c0_g1_i1.p1  ORF type:complete len:960 (+),score=68.67 TRINITY_DN22434_c0_g1_i1:44-2923(+)
MTAIDYSFPWCEPEGRRVSTIGRSSRAKSALVLLACLVSPKGAQARLATTLDGALASRSESFRILREALRIHGLGSSLERHPGRSTLFAPTDAAFERFFDQWGIDGRTFLAGNQGGKVNCLLQFAALNSEASESRLKAMASTGANYHGHRFVALPTMCGATCSQGTPSCWRLAPLHTDRNGAGEVQIAGGLVRTADVSWRKGVIHVVDDVPNPIFWAPVGARGLETALASRPDLRIFRAALKESGLLATLTHRAAYSRKYTMFAPTDSAFLSHLSDWGLTVEEFQDGGDEYRTTDWLLRLLTVPGFGDESDLWRAAAARGGRTSAKTLCPCGGTVQLTAGGRLGSTTLTIGGARVVASNRMWLGGPIHVLSEVPPAPCWKRVSRRPAPVPVPAPRPTQAPTREADVPSAAPTKSPTKLIAAKLVDACPTDLNEAIESHMGHRSVLLRAALDASGLGDRLESLPDKVTVFVPSDEALYAWMGEHRLLEDDLTAPSWRANECVQRVFTNLVHKTELSIADVHRWVQINKGSLKLPTLCSDCAGKGLLVTGDADVGNLRVGKARIEMADVSWCNGIVHSLDFVPLPPGWSPHGANCSLPPPPIISAVSVQQPIAPSFEDKSSPQGQGCEECVTLAIVGTCVAVISCLLGVGLPLYFFWLRATVHPIPEDFPMPKKEPIVVVADFKKPQGKKEKSSSTLDIENASLSSSDSTACPSEASWETDSLASSSLPCLSRGSSKQALYWDEVCSQDSSFRALPSCNVSDVSSEIDLRLEGPRKPGLLEDSPATLSLQDALPTPEPPPLPLLSLEDAPGWQKVWSESKGAYYYWNRRTGTTRWANTPAPSQPVGDPPSKPASRPSRPPRSKSADMPVRGDRHRLTRGGPRLERAPLGTPATAPQQRRSSSDVAKPQRSPATTRRGSESGRTPVAPPRGPSSPHPPRGSPSLRAPPRTYSRSALASVQEH